MLEQREYEVSVFGQDTRVKAAGPDSAAYRGLEALLAQPGEYLCNVTDVETGLRGRVVIHKFTPSQKGQPGRQLDSRAGDWGYPCIRAQYGDPGSWLVDLDTMARAANLLQLNACVGDAWARAVIMDAFWAVHLANSRHALNYGAMRDLRKACAKCWVNVERIQIGHHMSLRLTTKPQAEHYATIVISA